MNTLFGLSVFIVPDVPRYTLPETLVLPCGHVVTWKPGFREEINTWSRDYLGTTNMLPDGKVFCVDQHSFHLNPRTHAKLVIATHKLASGPTPIS